MHPLVVQSVSRENNLVLFDGGSKMLEVARFGSKLAKTSLFLIHDWEDETFEAGGADPTQCASLADASSSGFSGALEEIGFESVYEEFALHIGDGSYVSPSPHISSPTIPSPSPAPALPTDTLYHASPASPPSLASSHVTCLGTHLRAYAPILPR
eukprot:669003-Hanusia_phi.AAC.1